MTVQQVAKSKKAGRLIAILKGAFAGAPTPLKNIPTKEGESRTPRRKKKGPGKKRPRSLAGMTAENERKNR